MFLSESLEAHCWADRASYSLYEFHFNALCEDNSRRKLDKEAYEDFYKMLDNFYERSTGIAA